MINTHNIILEQVCIVLDTYIHPETILCLAVSGGADSVMMAIQIIAYYQQHHYDLSQLHIISIDHGVRLESKSEVDQVRLLFSQRPDIHFWTATLSCQTSREADLRHERRSYLYHVMQEVGADLICTGHHLQDRIETLLLNLCRGCNLTGMTALSAHDDMILRPLITLSKSQILQWCSKHQISYSSDPSNTDESVSLRNRIRSQVITPLYQIAQGFNGQFVLDRSFNTMFDILSGSRERQNQNLGRKLETIHINPYQGRGWGYRCINAHTIQTLEDMYRLLSQLGHIFNGSQATLQEFLHFICHSKSGSKGLADLKLYQSHGSLYIFGGGKIPTTWHQDRHLEIVIVQTGEVMFGPYKIDIINPSYIGCTIRFHRPGDYFHHKTISKILINRKIPVFVRSYIPIIVDNDQQVVNVCDTVWFDQG